MPGQNEGEICRLGMDVITAALRTATALHLSCDLMDISISTCYRGPIRIQWALIWLSYDQAGLEAGFTVEATVSGLNLINTQFFNDGTKNGYQFTTPGIWQMPYNPSGPETPAAVWVTIYSTTQTP